MKHILILLYITIAAFILQSCRHDDEPTPPVKETEETGRTVLVYMLAKSNGLGAISPNDYDQQDIDEMLEAAKAGDITDGRLLVYHSCSNGNVLLKEIKPDGVDTLKIYDNSILSQNYSRITEVLDDMESLAPARDYGLVLWGHGTGWLEESTVEDVGPIQTYAYGWENSQKNSINVTTLSRALSGRNLGFIYFDCCYMAGVEVFYQLRHAAPVIAAYPTEILGWGMPYDRNVKYFFSSTPDLVAAAQSTFDFYDNIGDNISDLSDYEIKTYRMATVSVVNTAALDRLAAATRKIYELNSVGIPQGYTPQSYTVASNSRYHDFGGYIMALDAPDNLRQEFEAALAETVIYENATEKLWGRLDICEHSGLSTFIMKNNNAAATYNYDNLEWFDDVASTLIK